MVVKKKLSGYNQYDFWKMNISFNQILKQEWVVDVSY